MHGRCFDLVCTILYNYIHALTCISKNERKLMTSVQDTLLDTDYKAQRKFGIADIFNSLGVTVSGILQCR